MAAAQRDSLIGNSSNGNPFEILQTIPVSNMDASDDDRPFAVPQPRASKKSKKSRSRARRSAPSSSLAQGISDATTQLQSKSANVSRATSPGSYRTASPQRDNNDEDLLGLFGDMASQPAPKRVPDRPAFGNSVSQPHPHANAFDFFDPLGENVFGHALETPTLSANNSNRSQSGASSVYDEELFDPNMWEIESSASDFFASEAQKAVTSQQASQPAVGLVMPGFDENNDDDAEGEYVDVEVVDDDGDENKNPDESDDGDRRSTENGGTKSREEDTKEKDDPPTNCLIEMHRGTALLKYPRRHGFPHFKHVQLSKDNRRIQWFSKRKSLGETCIQISDIREIRTGQQTETFQKFHQEVLEKASFSIVFGNNYRTFDVVAKSTDECNMWVKALKKLKQMSQQGHDLDSMTHLDVGIAFKDRNRPRSRQGSGNFVRANNSRQLKIDPVAMKQIERDMGQLERAYDRIISMANRNNIARSDEYHNISQVLSELEERIEELKHEVNNTRDTDMSKRDVWRANVDLAAIGEKCDVLLKVLDANGNYK